MALARVVEFSGVSADSIAQIRQRIDEGNPPEGMNPSEIVVLHDAGSQKALTIIFFATEEDYRQGDAILSAMPADETPGERTSVTKYEVAVRASM